MPESRQEVTIGQPVLSKNDAIAASNRGRFTAEGRLVINLISSPGSGKTTLLEAMAERLGPAMAVIVGDVQTERDAERLRAAGCHTQAIETGGACHLNAASVADAVTQLAPAGSAKVLIIENVGNLVCPAAYDLGEHAKIAILSVPEGDDKVLKYPSIFSRISTLVINKIDLLPHLDFNVDKVEQECRSLNDEVKSFHLSAKTGQGVDEFCAFLQAEQSALPASSKA